MLLSPLTRDYKSSSSGGQEQHSYLDSHSNNNTTYYNNKMTVPSIVSVTNKSLISRSITFGEWLKKENTIFIGAQAVKYAKTSENSPWLPASLNYKLYKKEISQNEFNTQFENYIRTKMWSLLPTLAGKELGCWCHDPEREDSQCHGKILQKLFREQSKQ